MGTALPLKSSTTGPGSPTAWKDGEIPEAKGRLLIFRGCAESAVAGQPEIIAMQGLLPDPRRQAMRGLKPMAALPWVAGRGTS